MQSSKSNTNSFQREGQNLYDDDKTRFSSNTLKSLLATNFKESNYYTGFKNYVAQRDISKDV